MGESGSLDDEFKRYARVISALVPTLKRRKDQEICNELLQQCEKLGERKIADVTRDLNSFMKVFVKIVQWTVENQPSDVYDRWRINNSNAPPDEDQSFTSSIERRVWLQKENKYMATKTLPCGIHMVYVATACDPSAGWQDRGLKLLRNATPNDV